MATRTGSSVAGIGRDREAVDSVAGLGVARLLLLLVVASGVVQMHTFGHGDGEHLGYPEPVAHAMSVAPATQADHDPPEPTRPVESSHLLTICLAILTAIGMAIAVGLLWMRLAVPVVGTAPPPERGATRWGRDPPPLAPQGRLLADLSVLRI
jgi:uncharacterized protein DUF6153